jgi:hypothetical protein
MDTLVTSSSATREWLRIIKSKIEEKIPSLIYGEFKYWASFKNAETKRNVVYLHPQKGQIRLFTVLDISFDKSLQQTPSSNKWADMFPSIFLIKSGTLIDKACDLIISSYQEYFQR